MHSTKESLIESRVSAIFYDEGVAYIGSYLL